MSFKEKKSSKLSYIIRIPENIDDLKNVNIIFFMHGYGDSMKGISQIGNLLNPENIHVFFNAPFKMDVGFGTEGFRWFEFPSNEDEFKFSQQAISQTIFEILNEMRIGQVSKPIIKKNNILFLKINDKRIKKLNDSNKSKLE